MTSWRFKKLCIWNQTGWAEVGWLKRFSSTFGCYLHHKILCSRMPESFDRQLTAIQLLWRITNTILDEKFTDIFLKCMRWHPHFTFSNGPSFCALMTFLNLVWSLKELVNQCLFWTFKWQVIKTKKETTQLVLVVVIRHCSLCGSTKQRKHRLFPGSVAVSLSLDNVPLLTTTYLLYLT